MTKSNVPLTPGSTQSIPRDQWITTLNAFTRTNRGAHATVEIMSNELGRLVELEDRPFEGISADVKDGEHTVWMTFGAPADTQMEHGIPKAAAIYILAATATNGAAVRVDSEDGTQTLLELSKPEDFALPPAGKS